MTAAGRARRRVGVLISGSGSNLQALIDACAGPECPAEIVLVISNQDDAYGLTRAQNAGIATRTIDHTAFPDRLSFEREILAALAQQDVEIVCLAGFMRILTPDFVERWRDRMLNVHPSLLPAYKGLHTHQRALDDRADWHGCTVHLVRPALDDGPLVVQARVPVLEGDDADSLAARVLVQEHRIYPLALSLLAAGRVDVDGDVALIDGTEGPLSPDALQEPKFS